VNPPIKRALISVTDKTNVVDFCRILVDEFAIEIVSTGGTAQVLKEAGITVKPIEAVTGFPEMMDGRVKTLHPKVHGGLLAKRDTQAHMDALYKHGIVPIDLVVVNLYAFEETIAQGVSETEAIEQIDIGGPSMLRSAAKNHASVTVVTNPELYDNIITELRAHDGSTTLEMRKYLAAEAFALTAHYDVAIARYLAEQGVEDLATGTGADTAKTGEEDLILYLEKIQDLRYGENPHQQAVYYRYKDGTKHTLAAAKQLQGKELSYNNILDTDAAWSAVRELSDTSCVIVKHTNPCGAASHHDITVAYQRAWAGDPISAFGGIIALNRPVTEAVVKAIFENKQFVEVVIAPSYKKKALKLLETKPNIRVLETGGVNPPGDTQNRHAVRSIEGGILTQTEDTATEDPTTFTIVSKAQPSKEQLQDLAFAWKICKSVKSNAIVLAKGLTMWGMGAGQPNRVNSARVAIGQAEISSKTGATGTVAASDAFIPFPDTVEVLAEAGITALIHPGGSIRDKEVIAAADAAGLILVATGQRHFRH